MSILNRISNLFLKKPIKSLFTQIYEKKKWGDLGTLSGPGSTLEETTVIRETLPTILKKYSILTMMDAPCGDFFWMQKVNLEQCNYIGVDIVNSMIQNNNKNFASDSKKFICADLINDTIPHADLIFCRDCLVHLSFKIA